MTYLAILAIWFAASIPLAMLAGSYLKWRDGR